MRIVPEIGLSVLQSPTDLCIIPDKDKDVGGHIVVADDFNGILMFDFDGNLIKHIKECSDAGSVAYDATTQQVIVSVSKAISNGDTSVPCELWFYDKDLNARVKILPIPSEPHVEPKNIRWVTVEPLTANILVCSGHIDQCALWRFTRLSGKWKTLISRPGDLEHPSIVQSHDGTLKVFMAEYTDEELWNQKIFTFDANDCLKNEETVIKSNSGGIFEPWSAVYDNESARIYVYDYQVPGQIFMARAQVCGGQPLALKGVALGGGQWVSLKTHDKWLLASCSDCIRAFRVLE